MRFVSYSPLSGFVPVRRFVVVLSLAIVTFGFAAGCTSKKKPVTTNPAGQQSAVEDTHKSEVEVTPKTEYTPPKAETVKTDTLPSDLGEITARYLKDVFFEFDKYDLSEESRTTLSTDADFFKKHPSVRFTLEGHCDERGTREYNLSLGEKRANAAKDYLVALGISEDRIRAISYGKERPFDPGHEESAWAKNRRGHFVVTAK